MANKYKIKNAPYNNMYITFFKYIYMDKKDMDNIWSLWFCKIESQ